MPLQRIKIFHFACQLLAELLSGESYLKVTGIPKDAKLAYLRAGYDFNRDSIAVCLSHPDFPEVPEGGEPSSSGTILGLEVVTSLEFEQATALRLARVEVIDAPTTD